MSSDNSPFADNQQVTELISDEYYCGFIEGEGCFYVGFSKRNDLPLKWQIITEFHLSQNPGGKNILEAFRKRLSCGYIKPNHPGSIKDKSWVLIIKDRKDLMERLLPFFKNNSLKSTKKEEFRVFSKVLQLIEKRKHLTSEGFKEIVLLVFALNRATKKKYSIKDLIPETSETIRQSPILHRSRYSPNPVAIRGTWQK